MLVSVLCAIIGALLILNGWQLWSHEHTMARERARWAAAFAEAPELPPILLTQLAGRTAAPTHPPFESHGVEVSFAPTVGVP
jgi:hypothetical protein